jgi:hypothetical protein
LFTINSRNPFLSAKLAVLVFIICSSSLLYGQEKSISETQKKVIISGYVTDSKNGELLAGVTIIDTNHKTGSSTNVYGFYSITVPAGDYELQYSYIGYQTILRKGVTDKNLTLAIALTSVEMKLGEVVIEAKRTDENVRTNEMSIAKLDVRTIKMVPSLLGEVDLVKVLQLLPGVSSTSEGATGFSVRGGNADQNLIILDEATIYNASHLMGFFSVFNNDAVKDVTLYKGDIPASYGGRLSSLLDVRMKDGNSKKIGVAASIGTVSSKLTIEGPVKKDQTTFLAAVRRTYADLFLPLAKQKDVRDNKLYFYDFNLKLSHVINENNRLYLSGYAGRDIFKNQYSFVGFGNKTASLRWNHLFSKKLFFNLSINYSRYNYEISTPEGDASSFKWISELDDYSARFDFTYFQSDKHKIRYGATSTYHKFYPGTVNGYGNTSADAFVLAAASALEHSLYASDEYKITDNLSVKYGLRFAIFQNIGPGTYYDYDSDYKPIDSTVYAKGKIFNTYSVLEPRLAFTYMVNGFSSVKWSYSRASQFITLAQNSTAGTPLDIWFPATPNVKPQTGDQFGAGYFRNFAQNMYEMSAEVYYKKFHNLIDFRDHAQLFLNPYLEGELRIGKGYSYGIETLIRKNQGRFGGWISYTYSRSFRIVPEINGGRVYNSPYDKPHNVSIVANYDISKRISASITWIYATGLPVTFPTGRAVIGKAIIPIYSDRNAYRMPDYHRLDVSITLKGKDKPDKKWQSDLNLSVYNVYNRHNAWAINFISDQTDPNVTHAEKTYLFSIIPALTYNIRF